MLSLVSDKVGFNSLWPHELFSGLPCPSPAPRACSNSCPLSQWRHPTTLSSLASFSSCPQSFRASGSFPMSLLFASGGQSIGASASVLPVNIQGWFPLGLTGLNCLLSKRLSRVVSNTPVWREIMTLLFNTLSRFFIAFLPRSNHLLISWLQSPTAVILESKK